MAEIKAQDTISLTSVKSLNDLAVDANDTADYARATAEDFSKVVNVVQWASNFGEYDSTQDSEVQDGKLYFREGSNGYEVVADPTGNPQEQGYYELSETSESITSYVSSHLSVDSHGLWLQTEGEAYKVCVTGTGVEIWNGDGIIAKYSTNVVLGKISELHIVLGAGELGFYDGQSKVAWISSNQLYIHDARVENELRIGNFAWVHREGRLTLKYAGGN